MDSNFMKVEGYSNLVRDKSTNAIINVNMNDYYNYKRLQESANSKNEKIDNLENELADIRNDINEIKNLLRALANESK